MTKINNKGITLTEVIIASTILAIIAIIFSILMKKTMETTVETQSFSKSVLSSHKIFVHFERDAYNANQIVEASSSAVTFILDWSQAPGYDPKADRDGDGVINIKDPDVDNDLGNIFTATLANKWQHGYNLTDDDEDGTAGIDYQVRYYHKDGALYRDYAQNANPDGSNDKKIAEGIKKLQFTYFGSIENRLGSLLDNGRDGIPGTDDTGEEDRIIDQFEIDATLPANKGHGDNDGDGTLDTALERQYITSIRVDIHIDNNNDDKTDYQIDTEVYPPLLPLKFLQQN